MTDFVLDFGTEASLDAACQELGFWNPETVQDGVSVPGSPRTTGELPGGGGAAYFLNIVGPAPTGYWARLRINGPSPFAGPDGLAIPAGVTVYPPVKYLADGVTPDPDYTQPEIGVIQ